MIVYDFEDETVQRTDEDGAAYESVRRGKLLVWFHDADPATDPPQQTYDWRSDGGNMTWATEQYPIEVKSVCCFNELASVWPNLTDREIRIGLEAALEKIEKR